MINKSKVPIFDKGNHSFGNVNQGDRHHSFGRNLIGEIWELNLTEYDRKRSYPKNWSA